MTQEFINLLISQGGLGGLAALALWLNNRQAQEALRRERENAERTAAMNAELLRALNENTRALVGLEGAIRNLSHERTTGREVARD